MASNKTATERAGRSDKVIKDSVIVHMRRGSNFADACRKSGIEAGNLGRSLRRKYTTFNELVKSIGNAPSEAKGYQTPTTEWGVEFEDERIPTFLLTLRDTNSRVESARQSGFRPSEIDHMLDPTHADYHAEFALAFAEEQRRSLWEIEDDVKLKAKEGDGTNQRWLLERLLPEYGSKARSDTEENESNYTVDRLADSLKALTGIMEAVVKREKPREVIDIEAERQADLTLPE